MNHRMFHAFLAALFGLLAVIEILTPSGYGSRGFVAIAATLFGFYLCAAIFGRPDGYK